MVVRTPGLTGRCRHVHADASWSPSAYWLIRRRARPCDARIPLGPAAQRLIAGTSHEAVTSSPRAIRMRIAQHAAEQSLICLRPDAASLCHSEVHRHRIAVNRRSRTFAMKPVPSSGWKVARRSAHATVSPSVSGPSAHSGGSCLNVIATAFTWRAIRFARADVNGTLPQRKLSMNKVFSATWTLSSRVRRNSCLPDTRHRSVLMKARRAIHPRTV